MVFHPRPKQEEVLAYTGGKMGVSAVPGSGKTWTLSSLAAKLVVEGGLEEEQEVLVVTLVNSAVDNFAHRVAAFVREQGLLPHLGYRVRTLHGLSHDIVRERPDLVNLADDFQIIDDRAADQIRDSAAQAWLRSHPFALEGYLDPEMEESRREWVRRDRLPDLVKGIALSFIRYAKDLRISPEALRRKLDDLPVPLPLAEMGQEIYADYQRALNYRGAVDFDDLIRLALQALEQDESYLERLRARWPYILEDEAQDSSRLQEQILGALVGPNGNWVRVGDPNQAIYETFTTASPEFLRAFLDRPDVLSRELPNSGRSSPSIIALANHLIDWTREEHPESAVRDALTPPHILPTPPGDPQQNPEDAPEQIYLGEDKFTAQEEIKTVVESAARWLEEHPEDTMAVLVPRNQRGFEVAGALKARGVPYFELLRSTSATRQTAGALANLVNYLAEPQSSSKLSLAYQVWRRDERGDEEELPAFHRGVAKLLRSCRQVEDYLWPRVGRDWLEDIDLAAADPDAHEELLAFREVARRWQGTTQLPIDQIVLTLAQDLFYEPVDLAVAHKLAVILGRAAEAHPDWRLPELTEELAVVARNERRFLGFSEDDTGFDPEQHKGEVIVATVHKAKGLEFDRVYLLSVNNYDFPSGTEYDDYISEPWYFQPKLNLEAEAMAQLEAAFAQDEYEWYQEGQATQSARLDYVRERLRLLYVGLTRARSGLIVTWNTGRRGELQQAVPLIELGSFWEDIKDGV